MANPLFNAVYYLTQNPDVFAAGYTVDTAYDHYTQFGADEAYVAGGLVRAPNPWFDVKYYLTQNADLIAGGVTPETALDHFLTYGAIEGRFPDAAVAANPITEAGLLAYAKANPDLLTAFRIEEDATELTEAQQNELTLQFYSYGYNESRPAAPTVFDVPDDTFTLTVNPDVATANVFDAPRGWTPGGTDQMNTLNDDDNLTGSGDNPTLNFTYVDDTDGGVNLITPTLNGIETINVDVVGTAFVRALDLQDATGVQNVNVARINANTGEYRTQNITEALSSMSVNNSHAEAASVGFDFLNSALSGAADEADVTLNNAALGALRIEAASEGYETLNLSSVGSANAVNVLRAEDLETLNISGDQDLTLGGETVVRQIADGRVEAENYQAGLANVIGSLSEIDASGLTGDIQIHLGAEVTATRDNTSGVPVDFTYTGAQGDDVVILTAGMNADDTIDGGEGDNTVVVTADAAAGTLSNFQNLFVKGQSTGVTGITVDTATLADLETVVIRNEGQDNTVTLTNPTGQWIAAGQNLTTTLNNVSETVAQDIILQHGNSGNNGIAANVVNVNTVAAATSVGISIVDGVNVNPRFNAELNTSNNVDNVSIADNDSESNTVRLANVANIDGTVTLTGGAVGQFMNLDATGNLFGYDTTGGNTDNGYVTDVGAGAAERLEAATIDAAAYAGNVVVRVSEADNATGAQTITMGAGNDTVIFDALNDNTAGLTISDTVDGGEGNDTLVIDGDGVNINVSASEWTNVSNFETIHLVGNGQADNNAQNAVNAYNLTLTNDLIAANGSAITGGRSIAIVNDNGSNALASANAGVTIDARSLNAQSSFSYDGQETDATDGTAMTDDRFIMSDANINGLAVIDGGYNGLNANTANNDVLEVRNAAVVTIGDLAGVSNVGTLSFTSDQAVTQTSQLVLDSATVDRLVNNTRAADSANRETLKVQAVGNWLNSTTTVNTALDLDARNVGGDFILNIDTRLDNIGGITNAGDDTVMMSVNLGGGTQVINLGGGTDTVSLSGTAGVTTVTAGSVVFATGAANQTFNLTGVELLDLSGVTSTITAAASVTGFTYIGDATVNADAAGSTLVGGAGSQTFIGGAGVDIITGGAGADILTGGGGADVFTYVAAGDSTVAARDTITDFTTLADVIDFSAILGGGAAPGAITGAAAALDGTAAEFGGNEIAIFDTGAAATGTIVYVDVDGDDAFGAGDMTILLAGVTGGTVPVAGDFLV